MRSLKLIQVVGFILTLLFFYILQLQFVYSQSIPNSSFTLCGTTGLDGTSNINSSINTYYPVQRNFILNQGGNSVSLGSVPQIDAYGNNFGTIGISAGDLLLIIQNQDATINFSNSTNYGANNPNNAPDGLGATGFTNIGNSGKYEYVIATNSVPLWGGVLHFKGSGNGNGSVYSYSNMDPSAIKGKSNFQIIRVPQYANLKLTSTISPPPYNGQVGGIIAFEVSGKMDFNGYSIDVSSRGFRGGYSLIKISVGNISDLYVTDSADPRGAGKGEGIAGTPRYVFDGYNAVDNLVEGLPGGSCARGAPGNAGGGGNDSNAGGAGGGNGNFGGNGAWGYEPIGGNNPAGGRPGSPSFTGNNPDITRLIMGGGGGGGHANDALTGVKGGVGGGIVMINANTISGAGTILANGGDGAPGVYGLHPDGSGGGGAGGTVLLKALNSSPTANITIIANGGKGGNTEHDGPSDPYQPHGPGGGGSGGIVYYNLPGGSVNASVNGGTNGLSGGGTGVSHHALPGLTGLIVPFRLDTIPNYLLGGGQICIPELTTLMFNPNLGKTNKVGDSVPLIIKIFNNGYNGNAGGIKSITTLPIGINFESATVKYTGSSGGPTILSNQGGLNNPILGDFNISPGDSVIIYLMVKITCIGSGTYNSSTEAVYLDPTRDYSNPSRLITAISYSFGGYNTNYNQTAYGNVGGLNYNGSSSNLEDIIVLNTMPTILPPNFIQNPLNICQGTFGALMVSNPLPNMEYQWFLSDTSSIPFFTGSNFKTPNLFSDTSFYVNAVYNGTCISNNKTKVSVKLYPYPVLKPDSVLICSGSSAILIGKGNDSTAVFNWYNSPSGGNIIFKGKSFNTPKISQNGTVYYAEISDSLTNCTNPNREPYFINVIGGLTSPKLKVLDSTSSSITFGWNSIPGADAYEVSLDSGKTFLVPSSGPQGLIEVISGLKFYQKQTLIVKALSSKPCVESALSNSVTSTTIGPESNIIYIPNAFTPNGDGNNDMIFVHSEIISSLLFQIYDQWGELLFSTNSKDIGWDGTYKGKIEPAGVYVFFLKAIDLKGNETIKKGTITLLR